MIQPLTLALCQVLALEVVGSEADSPHPQGGSPLVGKQIYASKLSWAEPGFGPESRASEAHGGPKEE